MRLFYGPDIDLEFSIRAGERLIVAKGGDDLRLYRFIEPERAPLAAIADGATHAVLLHPNTLRGPHIRSQLRNALPDDFGNAIAIARTGPAYGAVAPDVELRFRYLGRQPYLIHGPSTVAHEKERLVYEANRHFRLRELHLLR